VLGRIFTRFLRVVFVHGSAVFGHAFLLLVHAFALHLGLAGHVACSLLSTSEKLV
jgi:hypothetical protein